MAALQQLPQYPTSGSLNSEQAHDSPDNIPLQAFTMDHLNIDLSLDLEDSFSSMSSASFSGSSSVYDSYGTPMSGRSTPQGGRPASFDFDFCNSSALQYDFTPPSTASTGCFPLDPKMDNLEFQHSMQQQQQQQQQHYHQHQQHLHLHQQGQQHRVNSPATPTKKNLGLHSVNDMGIMELSMGSHQQLEMYGFNSSSPIQALSFGQPTPTPPHQPGSTPDGSSMWNFSVDSPIVFNKLASSNGSPIKPIKLESSAGSSVNTTLSSPAKRKVFIDEAQQKTSVLQQVQCISPHRQSMNHDYAQHEYGEYQEYTEGRIPAALSTIPRAGWKCQHPGCDKNFKRSEHLKRHIHTVHNPDERKNVDECMFCPKTFKNRPDNYRQHLRLHADLKRAGETGYRVYYAPGAAEELRREEEKTRNKRHKTKAQNRSQQGATLTQSQSPESTTTKASKRDRSEY